MELPWATPFSGTFKGPQSTAVEKERTSDYGRVLFHEEQQNLARQRSVKIITW